MENLHFLEDLAERLRVSSNVSVLYGQPIEAQGKTIIPVARVRYGFGGGLGNGRKSTDPEAVGSGAGAGGGIAVSPVGVIEITASDTRFVAVGQARRLAVVALLGAAVGLVIGSRWPR